MVQDLAAERVDLGDTRYETAGSISESLTIGDRFVEHQVATAGSAFIVSPSIIDEGVTSLRAAEVRDIYAGEITNWQAVGGPDREIRVIAGPDASPPRWLIDTFFDGVPETGVDVRFGKEATRINKIESRDDALGEIPVGFAVSDAPVLNLSVDGTRYSVSETGYPSTVNLACYTWGEPDSRERAFISYLQSPAGQRYVDRNRDFLPLDWEAD
ncbi:substrate-binding domain-containing protein [Halopiger xanaduensis]|uniref:substrate-binding domain-containing protein n=1 Tax=Halopiger xanaduensis TaxID=387343 RepID=UPI0006777EB0|nr:substrate-binding domain-containing protein [Halopiger xanaduensis]